MTFKKNILIGVVAAAAIPTMAFADGDGKSWDGQVAGDRYVASGAATSERILTDAEIRDIISRSGAPAGSTDVRYVGGSETAVETEYCCGGTEERYEERTELQETTEYIEAVTERNLIQPVQRTLIQPITREVLQPRNEDLTEDMVFETNRLPVRIDRDAVPTVETQYVPQVEENYREETSETYFDVVTQRDVIQPIERTTVVPVQRRITRPRTETITAEPRYETRTAPTQRNSIIVPNTIETVSEQLTEMTEERYTEVAVPYVATRNIYQPRTITTIQPIERQILRAQTEEIVEDTIYEEVRLDPRIERDPTPQIVENVIPQVTERTVLEVEDVYVDQVTRTIIQPVVVTTVQPVINEVLQGRVETETLPTRYEESTLASITESVMVPQTQVNYIPQVTEAFNEEYSESYFDAVTKRIVYQPKVVTRVQPVIIERVRGRTETVTNPTRYETVRASLVVLNLGAPCNCN
ncbi:hypothetical protein RYZ27_13905 [Hyphomonas sp. FCG-A18]|uniref:hypothetical protein n=1 Tax=Hyphomonas sp. FCG-A18 TaxID=3080019 RepID=UPI002B3248E0|nr:hypothetical protein RYZ27_13905 [Hyphomonas sp. FCG-A18]